MGRIPGIPETNFKKKIDTLVGTISQKLKELADKQLSKNLVQTICIYSQIDLHLWKKLLSDIQEKLKALKSKNLKEIKAENYTNIQSNVKELQRIYEIFSGFAELNIEIDGWKKILKETIENRQQNVINLIDQKIKQVETNLRILTKLQLEQLALAIKIFSALDVPQRLQLKQIVTAFKEVRNKILQLARRYIHQIRKVINSEDDLINKSDQLILIVSTCIQNAKQIMDKIRQVDFQVKSQLNIQLSNLAGFIRGKKAFIDSLLEKSENDKDSWSQTKPIYTNIKILSKLTGLIADDQQKKKCIQTINMCKQKLEHRLGSEKQLLTDRILNLQTPQITIKNILEVYKICNSICSEQAQKNEETSANKISIICQQIKDSIINTINEILGEVDITIKDLQQMTAQYMQRSRLSQQNENQKQQKLQQKKESKNIEEIQGQFNKIISIRKFFEIVRYTKFRPEQSKKRIQNTCKKFKKQFSKAFDHLMKQINNYIKTIIQQFQNQENQEKKDFLIKRDTAYRIKRMISTFIKFRKNEDIISIITEIGDLDIRETQIKENINDLKQSLQNHYDQNFDSKKYCYSKTITQSCQNMKCLDDLKIENQVTFGQLASDMRKKNDTITTQKQAKIEDLIKQEVDVPALKKVQYYLKDFNKGSRQNEKYLEIIEALNQHFEKRQKDIQKQIKKFTRQINSGIFDKMEEITQKIDALNKQKKQVNNIFRKQLIKSNTFTNQLIAKEGEKIIIASIQKIKKYLERGQLNQIGPLCNMIQQLEQYMTDLKGNQIIKNTKATFQIPQTTSISQYYENKLFQKKKQREENYLGSDIKVTENFIEQFESFTEKDQKKIANNLKKQLKKQLQGVKLKQFKNVDEAKRKITQDIYKKYGNFLPEKLGEDFQKMAQDKKNAVDLDAKNINEEITKNWKLENAYQSFQSAKERGEVFCYQIILKLSEKNYDEITKTIKEKSQKLEVYKQLVSLINSSFIQPFTKQTVNEDDQYKRMLNQKIYLLSHHFNFIVQRSLKNLHKIVEKRQKLDKEEFEEIEKQSLLNLESVLNILSLVRPEDKKLSIFKEFKQQDFINQLNSILSIQYTKITNLPSEVSIESLSRYSEDYLIYNSNSRLFNSLIDKINQGSTYLKNSLNRFEQKIISVEKNLQKIKDEIFELAKGVNNKKIIREVLKSNSCEEREKYFQGLMKDIECLRKLSVFLEKEDKQKLESSIKKKLLNIKEEIQQGHRISFDSIDKGFETHSNQFDKCINLMLDLGRIGSYHQYNKRKDQLVEKIKSKNSAIYENIKKSSEAIINRKPQFRKKIKQTEETYFKLKKEFVQKQRQKFQKKKNVNQEKMKQLKEKNQDNQDNQNQQKIVQLNYQIKQWLKEKDENIKKFEQDNNKKQEKDFQTLNRQFSSDMISYSKNLTIAYKSALLINLDRKYYKQLLQKQLQDDEKAFGKRIISMIYKFLIDNWKCTYSSMLVNSYDIFKTNQALQWEEKVKGRDIDYVLNNTNAIKTNTEKKDQLKNFYNNYNLQFKFWTQKYQSKPSPIVINELMNQIKTISSKISKFYHQSASDELFTPEKLLGLIFALWVINGSKIDEQDMIVEFTYKPHPAQIVAIILSLSLNKKSRCIPSVMTQILTGQGKSFVLGGMSAYLALCGFQVHCVCYSSYLTTRDYEFFRSFFQKLQVNKSIIYGTFDTACQSLLNTQNSRKGLRDIMQQVLTSKKQGFFSKLKNFLAQSLFANQLKKSNPTDDDTQNRKIMLIDQVDVFFDPNLFGNIYSPDIVLESDKVKALIKEVWKYYGECKTSGKHMKKQKIEEKKQFAQVTKQFQRLDKVLEEQIKAMILGSRSVDHDYIIKNDKIQYKNQDTVTSKIHYGFQTVFAYLKQLEQHHLTTNSAEKQIKISLIVGQFSYALLPTFFKSIIGVTGTYQILPLYKKNLMKTQYKVNQIYLIPSVYGNVSERKIYQPIIVKAEQFWNKVIEEIKEVHKTGRPILVFFRDNNQLARLYSSPAYGQLQMQTTFLNETHDADDRNHRINQTCGKGKITFMTRSFGRGTDFIIHSHEVQIIKQGGLHVIQTFISVEKSEEVQIMGRTARQGNPGTYQLIIPQQDLQLLQLQLLKIKNPIEEIDRARKKNEEKQMSLILKKLNDSNQKHKQCLSLYTDERVNINKVVDYIHKLNSFPQLTQNICKTTILVDATSSMSGILRNLLNVLGQVVRDVIKITNKNSKVSSSQLQICIYRNYNSPCDALFQSTPFETQSTNLELFLNCVTPQGGWGNQAIQVALNYVNSTPEINQVIIIGDARANTKQQVFSKRMQFGENYWIEKKVPHLFADQQVQKIRQKNIQIHSFYVSQDKNVENYFKNISSITGGTAQRFNPNERQAASKLSTFLAEKILTKASQSTGQTQKVLKQYRKMRNTR